MLVTLETPRPARAPVAMQRRQNADRVLGGLRVIRCVASVVGRRDQRCPHAIELDGARVAQRRIDKLAFQVERVTQSLRARTARIGCKASFFYARRESPPPPCVKGQRKKNYARHNKRTKPDELRNQTTDIKCDASRILFDVRTTDTPYDPAFRQRRWTCYASLAISLGDGARTICRVLAYPTPCIKSSWHPTRRDAAMTTAPPRPQTCSRRNSSMVRRCATARRFGGPTSSTRFERRRAQSGAFIVGRKSRNAVESGRATATHGRRRIEFSNAAGSRNNSANAAELTKRLSQVARRRAATGQYAERAASQQRRTSRRTTGR